MELFVCYFRFNKEYKIEIKKNIYKADVKSSGERDRQKVKEDMVSGSGSLG